MANPPARIVDPANLQALFYKIMERYQVKASEIKNMKVAIVDVHGRGLFDCFKCHHSWNSHYSWVKLDLKEMKVIYRWKMKCQNCYRGHPAAAAGIQPTFGVEEMEIMIEKAVCRYKGVDFPKKNMGNRRRREFVPPHLSVLCEKCGWGQARLHEPSNPWIEEQTQQFFPLGDFLPDRTGIAEFIGGFENPPMKEGLMFHTMNSATDYHLG